MWSPVVRQFLNNNGPDAGNPMAYGSQACTVSVLDFATPPSPPRPARLSASDVGPSPSSETTGRTGPNRIPELYVDRVLERAEETMASSRNASGSSKYVRGHGLFGGENSITFFSENRLKSLSDCLGHDRVRDLVNRIAYTINQHLRTVARFTSDLSSHRTKPPVCLQDKERLTKLIRLYFENLHPRFPFLDRAAFEATAASQDQPHVLPRSKSWTSLYHTVLALGSQYDGGGSFQPDDSESWGLFSVALANFTNLILLPDSLTTLQALTAMTIYTLGMSGIGLEHVIMSEAVRRAKNLADARFNEYATQSYRRTFWVLYSLEKITSFHHGKSSEGFSDCDISCPIPYTPESNFGGLNWLLTFVRHARLLSRAYTSLFSVGVMEHPDEYFLDIIDQLAEELEDWRAAIPDNGFRPAGLVGPQALIRDPGSHVLALVTHFCYNSFLQTISRMALRHLPASNRRRREAALKTVEETSRALLEMTSFVDVAPYTPMWMLAGIPMAGFFVIFDLVIHNPLEPQTASNLALLDLVVRHTSRLEQMSNGKIPGSLIGEFTQIARAYVNQVSGRSPGGTSEAVTPQSVPGMSQGFFSQPHWSLPHDGMQDMSAMDVAGDFSDMNLAAESGQAGFPGPMDIEGLPMAPNTVMGTDVMNLFGCWVPDFEPQFYHGLAGQVDLLPPPDHHMTPDHHLTPGQ
ncbi:fungal specific transcription factor domain containing protein [Colletotrichum musicola]|uniref:Fungal specific transcription factor domain containing protein n=1 Tax=Colletotrichum musicola TaxID=2175873 RepID=A0A8H6NP77_9PEZI|nr:fungal specific transcription factor domain containing protein [Colletotrichum musicola]